MNGKAKSNIKIRGVSLMLIFIMLMSMLTQAFATSTNGEQTGGISESLGIKKDVTYNEDMTKGYISMDITEVPDDQFTIKEIIAPDESNLDFEDLTYEVEENGEYIFRVIYLEITEDSASDAKTLEIKVTVDEINDVLEDDSSQVYDENSESAAISESSGEIDNNVQEYLQIPGRDTVGGREATEVFGPNMKIPQDDNSYNILQTVDLADGLLFGTILQGDRDRSNWLPWKSLWMGFVFSGYQSQSDPFQKIFIKADSVEGENGGYLTFEQARNKMLEELQRMKDYTWPQSRTLYVKNASVTAHRLSEKAAAYEIINHVYLEGWHKYDVTMELNTSPNLPLSGDWYTLCKAYEEATKVTIVVDDSLTYSDTSMGIGMNEKIYSNEIINPLYIVTYNANGGTCAPEEEIFKDGEKVLLSNNEPLRNDYSFLGWSEDPNATSPSYQPGQVLAESIKQNYTLYAVWKLGDKEHTLNYQVPSSENIKWWSNYTKAFFEVPGEQIGIPGERLKIENPILKENPYGRNKPFVISLDSYATPNNLHMREFAGWSSTPGPDTSYQAAFDQPQYPEDLIANGKALFDTDGKSSGITENGKLYGRYRRITFSLDYDANVPKGATKDGEIPQDNNKYNFAERPKVQGNSGKLSIKKDGFNYELLGWSREKQEPVENASDANIEYTLADCERGAAKYQTKETEEICHMGDVNSESTVTGGITADGTLYAVWRRKNDGQISFEQEMMKLRNVFGQVTTKSLPKIKINGVDATPEQMADMTYKYEQFTRTGKAGAYTYGWARALTEGTDDKAISELPVKVSKPESGSSIISASTVDNLSGIVRLTVSYKGKEGSCVIIIPGDVNLDKRISTSDLEKLTAYVYGEAEPGDYEYQRLMSVFRNDDISQNAYPSIKDLEFLENILFG